jgi:hypothetical protein
MSPEEKRRPRIPTPESLAAPRSSARSGATRRAGWVVRGGGVQLPGGRPFAHCLEPEISSAQRLRGAFVSALVEFCTRPPLWGDMTAKVKQSDLRSDNHEEGNLLSSSIRNVVCAANFDLVVLLRRR